MRPIRDERAPLLSPWLRPHVMHGILSAMDPARFALPPESRALPRVLLVGHPAPVAARLAAALRADAADVEIAADGPEALLLLERFRPGVVLLYATPFQPATPTRIAPLARAGDCGVIVLLAEDAEAARVAGLDAGADDVLSAGAADAELGARMRAVHRRVRRASLLAHEPAGQIVLEPAHRCLVSPDGARTALSEAEFIALETLLDADGAAVSRDWLGRVALKRPLHSEDRSVDQLVLKLRRKLVAAGASERIILSARRQGYVIADPSRFRNTAPLPEAGRSGRRMEAVPG
jgi:two-component system OmpR family response regulator